MREPEWVCRTAWACLAKGWSIRKAAATVGVPATRLDAMLWHWRADKTASRE